MMLIKNIIKNVDKIIHHDHSIPNKNIIGYICSSCNLQIQNRDMDIPIYFHNGSRYDNNIFLEGMTNNFAEELNINCIGTSSECFKMVNFKFKNLKYGLKLLYTRNFLQGSLSELSQNLPDKYKIETKRHFEEYFELLKKKACFPYECISKENIFNEKLPSIYDFYSKIKLESITEEDYLQTLEIFEKLKCKNIKDYLDIYLKLDILSLQDIWQSFRNDIWKGFEVDCSKYISSPGLSLDLMLKYTDVKIELIKDILIFDFVNSSIFGGICISSQNIMDKDKDNSTISIGDIVSLYPYVMSQKLPISNYKFVDHFNKNKYGENKGFSCLVNCEIYTTEEVKNHPILKQFPALISRTKIKYDNLSEYQRKNLKSTYKSSDKLISHLGYDKNQYIPFEMYNMLESLVYDIKINKILEYKHSNFMKPYINL